LESNLKIAINAASAKMGGAVTYLSNLLRHLPSAGSGFQFFVFLPSETAKGLLDIPASIKICPLPAKMVGGWRRLWWEQITLRRFLVREKVDASFSTANFAMLRCPVKQILLVRNALYFSKLYQQIFLPRHRLRMRIAFRLRRWMICRSIKSADIVVTPTRAMLDELRAYVDVPEAKALVCPYGVDPPNAQPSQPEREEAMRPRAVVRLLYVSLYSDHKNLNTLLKAIPILNNGGPGRFLLNTTVSPAWEGAAWTATHGEDMKLSQQPGISPWVRFLGPLPKEQMEHLYRGSDIFVFPSLTESFGFPMAEAMSYGLPIVASDTPVNREICGEAAIYFNPLNAEDLARQIRLLARDATLREHLSAKGQERARTQFRWDTHVGPILDMANRVSPKASEEFEPERCFK
jgi:glycosyltransferase involved in cell wall biosynthesis